MEYFIDGVKKYTVFTGRATRKEYWMFVLFYVIFAIVIAIIESVIGTSILGVIFSLALLLPSIAIATRRLHDTGRSGWMQLIVLIPIIGIIVLIVFLAQETKG